MDKDRTVHPCRRLKLLPLLCLPAALWACMGHTAALNPPRPGLRNQVVVLALNLAGIPYAFGGRDIDGFDCSGLVYYVYDCFGIRLPRSAREQSRLGRRIRFRHAQPGDILAFKLKKGWHSAIYVGDERFVHAPSSGGWVRLEALGDYWQRHLRAVIAVLPRGR